MVLTEVLAADLGAEVGDLVTIRGNKGSREFKVSGIYHCANDIGANLGMNREGYLSIGEDDSRLWCYHYFLNDTIADADGAGATDAGESSADMDSTKAQSLIAKYSDGTPHLPRWR